MTSSFRFSKIRQNWPFLAFSMNFCPLKMELRLASPAMLNKTFYVIFKHCGSCPWSLYLFYVWSSIFYQIKFAWADLSKATLYSHVVYKVYHQLLSSSHFSWLQRKNILQSNGDCSSNAYVKLICLMYLDLGLVSFYLRYTTLCLKIN